MVVQHVVKQNQIFQSDDVDSCKEKSFADLPAPPNDQMETATLLDLYSGCGAMSTGLCMGAALSGIKLCTVSFLLNVLGLSLAEMTNINIIALCRNGL
jgi:hypothetical protein